MVCYGIMSYTKISGLNHYTYPQILARILLFLSRGLRLHKTFVLVDNLISGPKRFLETSSSHSFFVEFSTSLVEQLRRIH